MLETLSLWINDINLDNIVIGLAGLKVSSYYQHTWVSQTCSSTPNLGMDRFWSEHVEHTIRPHIRQWCLRVSVPNFLSQDLQAVTSESGTQLRLMLVTSVRPVGIVGSGGRL